MEKSNQVKVPEQMNSVLIVKNGVVDFGQVPVQKPGKNQVLIKVDSATLNPSDILFMRGLYNIKLEYPYTPGWEGSGVVIQAGEGEKAKALVGKKCAFMKAGELGTYKMRGAFADYIVTSIDQVFPLSDDIDLEDAASFVVNPLTAVCMVERIKQLKSKCVIITAAASQIGRMLVRLCKNEGIQTICVVRRQEHVDILQGLGVEAIVNTSLPDYQKTLGKFALKMKPSTCLECIAGSTTGEMLDYLSFGSTLIIYGLLSDQPAGGIKVIPFIGKAQTIESFLLSVFLAQRKPQEVLEVVKKAEAMLKNELKTTINARYGFHQINEAIKYYLQNQTAGKILLKPSLTKAEGPKL